MEEKKTGKEEERLDLKERGGVEETPESKDKVQPLKDQVDGVKSIMMQNVDRILAQGERVGKLVNKTEDLEEANLELVKVDDMSDIIIKQGH